MKTSLLNKDVWCAPDDLDLNYPYHGFINHLLKLGSANLDFVANRASNFRNGVPCNVDTSCISAGGFNIAFPVIFEDDVYWLLRITCPPLTESEQDSVSEESSVLMLESSVTTARYLRLHSQIPIPNIHFFDSSRQNPIGAAFIVMDFIDGIPIPYSEVDPENSQQLDKIYDQACHIAYELSTHCFDRVGALYELDASLATIIGPTWDSRQNPCGPFTNAKDYYMTLSNGYWDEAQSSPHLSRLPLSENWNWNEANKSDRDLLTAFLHLKTFSLIQWENFPDHYCLQHRDFKLRYFLVDSEYKIVGVIDWDGVSTVPSLGYNPFSFCLAIEGHERRCLQIFAKWERKMSGKESVSERYESDDATRARLLGTALSPSRTMYAPQLFKHCYSTEWETGDALKRGCMKEALELVSKFATLK